MGLFTYLLTFWSLSYIYHEFLSGKRRKLRRRIKHFRKNILARLRLDSDILLEKNVEAMQETADNAAEILSNKEASVEDLEKFMNGSEKKIDRVYPAKSNAGIRETIEMLVVVFGIVMGIRSIGLQPFKIPTGSMQPTLFGVHFDRDDTINVPGRIKKIFDWVNYSTTYVDHVVKSDGGIDAVRDASLKVGTFSLIDKTDVTIGGDVYSLPGTPQQAVHKILSEIAPSMQFHKGQAIRGESLTGDHIMVDRLSYHFVEPKRGDVFVFITEGITYPDGKPLAGRHFIKRLVGMPEDTLKVSGGKLYVKQKGAADFALVDGTFHKAFNRIYCEEGGYHGYTHDGYLLTHDEDTFTLGKDQYFAMGDNSGNSSDSRAWGVVPRRNIIGKAMMVWWPFSRRWGWIDRAEPTR